MGIRLPVELKGLGKALLVAIILGVATAVVVYFTGLQETLLGPLSKLVLIISVFWGGCHISKAYGSKGLIRGMSLGLMFFIIMLIATLIFNPALIGLKTFISNLLICIVSGALGGILGIGLSTN